MFESVVVAVAVAVASVAPAVAATATVGLPLPPMPLDIARSADKEAEREWKGEATARRPLLPLLPLRDGVAADRRETMLDDDVVAEEVEAKAPQFSDDNGDAVGSGEKKRIRCLPSDVERMQGG